MYLLNIDLVLNLHLLFDLCSHVVNTFYHVKHVESNYLYFVILLLKVLSQYFIRVITKFNLQPEIKNHKQNRNKNVQENPKLFVHVILYTVFIVDQPEGFDKTS